MDIMDKMAKEAEKKRAADLRRRALAVHEVKTEHVRARINELHHLVGLEIAPALVSPDKREQLEHAILDAVNQARSKLQTDEDRDPIRRIIELAMDPG